MRRLRRAVRRQAGYSLIEALVVMLILGTILGGLTTVFVQGSNAELGANRRVRAQLQATAAFDRLRRDIHCASSTNVAAGSPVSSITLTGCASGSISWCTAPVSSGRYALYRFPGAITSCDPALGSFYADYLTEPNAFTYWAPVAGASLAKVTARVVVEVDPVHPLDAFELSDDIVMRNSTRT